MKISLLGPLEIQSGAVRLRLGGTKQRAVLAMLVLRANQVVSTDYLIDGLWGQAPPDSAINVVQAYVSRLRKVLGNAGTDGPPVDIVRRRPGYLVQLDPEMVDLVRFDRLARAGVAALPAAPSRAAGLLRDAVALWRGTPLAEFPDEPFAANEGHRLQEQYLAAVAARVDADLMLGRHAELIAELEALVADHPLHEGLHGQLMLSLYRSGRQAEALEAYRRARRTFADDLGIDPGPALRALEAAILDHDQGLDWSAPPPEPARIGSVSDPIDTAEQITAADTGEVPTIHGRSRVWNVPARNPHFTGRVDLLDQLHAGLRSMSDRLAVQTLYGLGGVGKSQLAIEYAHLYADEYALVWWINAEQPVLIPDQLTALAGRLGIPTGGGAADVIDRLMTDLSLRSGWLLIFDNADHPRDIAEYRAAGHGQVIVTSRSPGWGALGGRIEVDVLSHAETVALLRARTPQISPGVAEQLAIELGNLPLAAAQAAAYLEQTGLDPKDYLRRFRTRRSVLLAQGDVLGYQGRIETAWELSLQRLRTDNPAAVALLELSAFLAPEPIPLDLFTAGQELLDEPLRAAAADADDLDDAVGAGVGFSLARRHPDGFQLHRLVQSVIRHRLSPERQHAVSARAMKLLAAAHPGDPNDPVHWPVFRRLAPHILATSTAGEENPANRDLMLATVVYLNVRGDPRASRFIAERLVTRWRGVLGADHPDTLTAAANLTTALVWLAEDDQARDLSQDTLQRSRRVLGPDHPVTLRLATNLTFALAWLGEAEQACRLGQDNLERSRRVLGPDSSDTLRLAANLTFALTWHGDAEQARTLGEETLRTAREALGLDHPVTLVAAAHLALALAWLGDTDADRTLGEDTLRRARRALGPDHPTTLASAAHLTFILTGEGDSETACKLGRDTLQRSEQALGHEHLITIATAAVLVAALTASGRVEQARTLGEDTLERARRRLGNEHFITLTAAAAVTAALAALGDLDRARTLGGETLLRARQALGPDHLLTQTLARAVDTAPEHAGEHGS